MEDGLLEPQGYGWTGFAASRLCQFPTCSKMFQSRVDLTKKDQAWCIHDCSFNKTYKISNRTGISAWKDLNGFSPEAWGGYRVPIVSEVDIRQAGTR